MTSSDQSSGEGAHVRLTDQDRKYSSPSRHVDGLKQVQDSISKIQTDNGSNDVNHTVWGPSGQDDCQGILKEIEEFKNDLDYIADSLKELGEFEGRASRLLYGGALQPKELSEELCAANKIVSELKLRIPLPQKLSFRDFDARRRTRDSDRLDKCEGVDESTGTHFQAQIQERLAAKDFSRVFESLDQRTQMCLLCFAVIPENEVVKKRFMIYWWISEDFVSQDELDAEESYKEADRIFEKLVTEGCIEPVNGKDVFAVNSYKMNPFIRLELIVVAKKAMFFDFHEEKGYPTAICSSSCRVCLVKGDFQESVEKISRLRIISELVEGFSKKREFGLVAGISKESGNKNSALVERLREMEIESKLLKRLLEMEIDTELAMVSSKHSSDKESALVKRLRKKKIDSELVKRLQEIEIHSKLVKRLREIDSVLVNWVERLLEEEKDSGKRDPALVKILQEIEKDSALVKRLCKLGKDSALINRLREIGEDSGLVQNLLKMKIGTQLVKRLLEMEKYSKLVNGFFKKLWPRFSQLQEICELVLQFSQDGGEGSEVLMKIGAELVNGSSKVLGEIGAELINKFSKELGERGPAFSTELQKKCTSLQNTLLNESVKLEIGDPEKVQIIINVNESCLDFLSLELFSKLNNIKVLYLGRWQTSGEHHIEVESIEFLEGLKSMKLLRFFSLQGISGIVKLPDPICKLSNLRILDLRACHNLEVLPEGIGSLKELTHLDISDCYHLNHMPRGIRSLSKLLVFKGFLLSSPSSAKSCTVKDLLRLKKLRKLSIYANRKNFPTHKEVSTFHKFKKLQRLTITWGAGESLTREVTMDGEKARVVSTRLGKYLCAKQGKITAPENSKEGQMPAQTNHGSFRELQKLDLRGYPEKETPSWLLPDKIPHLKKLYIRGGKLQSLSPAQKRWKVEILRLKFLYDLRMDWEKLRSSFPDLVYLETVECPKLTYLPPTENGVWRKDENISE